MTDLTQIVWLIVLFPVLCTVTIFVTVLAHNKAQDWYHQRYGTDATVNDNVVTLFRKQISALNEQILDAAKLFNKLKDEIEEIKSDGYHWNVLTSKLVESEERNIRRMESTESDVRNIMSNLHRMDDEIDKLIDYLEEE